MRREQHTSSAADPTPPRSRGAEVGCIPTIVQILFNLRQQGPCSRHTPAEDSHRKHWLDRSEAEKDRVREGLRKAQEDSETVPILVSFVLASPRFSGCHLLGILPQRFALLPHPLRNARALLRMQGRGMGISPFEASARANVIFAIGSADLQGCCWHAMTPYVSALALSWQSCPQL